MDAGGWVDKKGEKIVVVEVGSWVMMCGRMTLGGWEGNEELMEMGVEGVVNGRTIKGDEYKRKKEWRLFWISHL